MKKLINFWLPPVLWGGLIFFVSSRRVGTVSEIYWQDFTAKSLAHVFEYAILALLVFRALTNSKLKKSKSTLYTLLIIIFFGITDEIHQSFVPGRDPRVHDVIFDTIGAIIALWTARRLLPSLPPKLRKLPKILQLI